MGMIGLERISALVAVEVHPETVEVTLYVPDVKFENKPFELLWIEPEGDIGIKLNNMFIEVGIFVT
jgi:hypothetical protein